MFLPFVFFFSKFNLVLVSSAKITALQPAVFYSARELVLVQYEQGMLWSGMDALRKEESVSCTFFFSNVVHSPNAGDVAAALWIFTALSLLHKHILNFLVKGILFGGVGGGGFYTCAVLRHCFLVPDSGDGLCIWCEAV